jgi:hypothetical protein
MSVCVSLLSLLGNGSVKCNTPFVARQQLGKHVPRAINTFHNKTYCWTRVSVGLSVYLLSLPGNNSVKTSAQQRKFFAGVIFYAVRVVSKESRPLVLLRTSCCLLRKRGGVMQPILEKLPEIKEVLGRTNRLLCYDTTRTS